MVQHQLVQCYNVPDNVIMKKAAVTTSLSLMMEHVSHHQEVLPRTVSNLHDLC